MSPRVLIDGSALRNLARASRARGEFAFHLTKQLSLCLFLKRLQHKFQDEASYGNDCACDQKIRPRALILPTNHCFTTREQGNCGTGEIDWEQIGFHLLDRPNQSGKGRNDCGDFVRDGHVFPVHNIVLSCIKILLRRKIGRILQAFVRDLFFCRG